MGDKAASPSPAVSSAKSRRLDALHRRLGGKRAGAAQHPGKQTSSAMRRLLQTEHHAFLCGGVPPAETSVHFVEDVRHLLARRQPVGWAFKQEAQGEQRSGNAVASQAGASQVSV
jgi:hypothetical protein